MKFIKQKHTLKIHNLDHIAEAGGIQKQKREKHGPFLPNSIRAIICGRSGCGKTNLLLNLIFGANGLAFHNIYIFSKSLDQPKYRLLSHVMKGIPHMGYFTYGDNSEVIPPDKARSNSLFIFDDISTQKQDNIRDYFCMGRHKNIDSFYLCQTYSKVPKQLIRDNCNLICIFEQDDLNLHHIFSDHNISSSIPSFEEFKNMCNEVWKQKSFLTIDKDVGVEEGRFRRNIIDAIIIP